MIKRMEITRLSDDGIQTLGELKVYEDSVMIFSCKTLELAWKENQRRISCIPLGTYRVTKYNSPTKGRCFLLHEVPGRTYIEIHKGNFYFDIEGCILPGKAHVDINGDGLKDVSSSTSVLNELLALMPSKFEITIK